MSLPVTFTADTQRPQADPTQPRSSEQGLRVLHGPANIGNQPWVLSRAERALGLDSCLVTNYDSELGYNADRVLRSSDASQQSRDTLFRITSPYRFDAFHFYFGQSLIYQGDFGSAFDFIDLKLAKALGKTVIMTVQGCDVRLAGENKLRYAFGGACHSEACGLFNECISVYDNRRRRLIEGILPLCDRVFYLNPDLGHVLKGEYLPYASVDLEKLRPGINRPNARPRIVHAPTSRSIKGTAQIEAALERLSSCFDFEYIPVEGVPHEQALSIYHQADLVIDQILIGWYGGLAVEAMAMGKPVAAFLREQDLSFVPPAMRADMPILRIDPRFVERDLATILERVEDWPKLGHQSRAFVERWHNPGRIAAALVQIYRDPAAPLAL